MAKMVLTLAGERYDNGNGDCGWKLVRYIRIDYGEDAKVRDNNYLNGIAEKICNSENNSSWVKGAPEDDKKLFFDIYLTAMNHGKDNAEYKIDYHKYDGCPQIVIEEGMEIYRIIKTEGVRPSMEAVRMNRKLAKGNVKAKFADE